MSPRTTEEVFTDHLQLREKWDFEEDLRRNYAHDVVLICSFGVLRGREAVKESAERLGLQLPGAQFEFTTREVADEYAFLVWQADSDQYSVTNGVDTFVIRDSKIVMQSIYYSLTAK